VKFVHRAARFVGFRSLVESFTLFFLWLWTCRYSVGEMRNSAEKRIEQNCNTSFFSFSFIFNWKFDTDTRGCNFCRCKYVLLYLFSEPITWLC